MDKRYLFVIFLVVLAVVAFWVVKDVMEGATDPNKAPGMDAERAASETIPDLERDEMRPKDRAYGGAHKRKAYDDSKKAHDRTGDYLEKHEDDIYGDEEGGNEDEDEDW